MGLLPTVVGIASGVFVRAYANALNKQRLLLAPWKHVGSGIAGGIIGYYYFKVEDSLLLSVNEKRRERGIPELTRETLVNYGKTKEEA